MRSNPAPEGRPNLAQRFSAGESGRDDLSPGGTTEFLPGCGHLYPIFYYHAHLLESSFEKMISGFDADELLRVGKGVDERFKFTGRAELIARAADEQLGFRALAQKFEIVDAVFNGDGGQAERDERADSVVRIGGAQSDGGSEGKAGEDYRKRELAFEPIEGGAHVFDFADAVGMLAFAQSGAAEVEAQHGESEAVERFHGVEDDFVVQRSTVKRMRMAHHGGMGRVGRSGVEQGFQASGGAGEEERADAGGFVDHALSSIGRRS